MRKDERLPAHPSVARLMDGYLITQLLHVAAKLNIADILAAGPQDPGALARSAGADPAVLRRVLRGLAAEGVFDELADGRFALGAAGTCLRANVPGSLRAAVIARGELYYAAAAGMLDAARHGGVPFERVHGAGFFDYLAARPDSGAAFQASMEDRARNEAAAVVAAYDFADFERLVDVGGGQGVLLAEILAATPRLHGTLFDLPAVVDRAREKLADKGFGRQCGFVAGDFLAAVPPGGSAYLLSRVIHDWDDAAAVTILRNCRSAMQEGGTLLLVEAVLPERAADAPAAIRMDLHMLTLLRGRERTAAEYGRLLAAAGFGLRRVVPTDSSAGVGVIEAGPLPSPP